MFERRLKILLILLFVVTTAIALRAVQVQVVQRTYWRERAAETMKRSQLIESVRGRLLDHKGREIAIDAACIDACVDYRAIPPSEPDPVWVRDQALARLHANLGDDYRKVDRQQRAKLLDDEIDRVKTDLEIMWATLAKLSHQSIDQIDDIRRAIVHRVEMRRRYVWYRNYENALQRHDESHETLPWYRQWLLDDSQDAPQIDSFAVAVAEEQEAHPILRAIDTATNNYLAKNIDKFPGLALRASTHRVYPYGDGGCHLLGHLSRVAKEDLASDPNEGDELRQYLPNDLIGRNGLEALCEPILRGTRGRIERLVGEDGILSTTQPIPGRDARSTIDMELQTQIQSLFKHATLINYDDSKETCEMHGAAVVIDVKTGEVRALVSNPSFDLNTLDDDYATLAADEINRPLLNRATQAQLEPGSTIKPAVGLSGIMQGVVRVDEGIECTGYLVLPFDGRQVRLSYGRCWTMSKFGKTYPQLAFHHQVPTEAPHPTGFLTYPEALERSCNVYFETVADRLGTENLSTWLSRFGFGRPTGVGIAEVSGRLPNERNKKTGNYIIPAFKRRAMTFFSGIGQGWIAATPIQMANLAATVARDGIWVRPHLVGSDVVPSTRPSEDRVDLHLSPVALAAAKQGMINVVNSRAGTGTGLHFDNLLVAGKTGTAEAARFSVPVRDAEGHLLRDETGNVVRRFLEPATHDHPTDTPWYRGWGKSGEDLKHAWFIGFAPAKTPQVAFCVLVEYGGSGGLTAAPIARGVLEACIDQGYLSTEGK